MACDTREPEAGLIFHSDRGAQYTSHRFQQLLHDCAFVQSFSHSGRPHDNAVAESFFASLKKEELYRRDYPSEAAFKHGIDSYIEFYNTQRPHRTLKNLTPCQIEKQFMGISWTSHDPPMRLSWAVTHRGSYSKFRAVCTSNLDCLSFYVSFFPAIWKAHESLCTKAHRHKTTPPNPSSLTNLFGLDGVVHEDMAKGVFYIAGSVPQQEPQKGTLPARAVLSSPYKSEK